MKKIKCMKKILITIALVVILVPAGVIGIFMYSTSNMCANEIYKEVNSPSQEFKAVIFQRDCGATTSFSTQISIVSKATTLPNESGNILIIDGHPNDTLLEINWQSNGELSISKNLNGSEYKAEKSIELGRKIKVSYGSSKS
jgi:hypothetical protein